MLSPKKSKFRKAFRGRGSLSGVSSSNLTLSFGEFGLKAQTRGEVNSRQIESARRAMTRYIKRGGKIWIKIFPHKPVTIKAAEVPMGCGKGTVDQYVSVVKPGTIMFEMAGVEHDIAKEALRLASQKLPVKCKFITIHHA